MSSIRPLWAATFPTLDTGGTHLCSTETSWTMEDSSLSTFPAVQTECQTLVL